MIQRYQAVLTTYSTEESGFSIPGFINGTGREGQVETDAPSLLCLPPVGILAQRQQEYLCVASKDAQSMNIPTEMDGRTTHRSYPVVNPAAPPARQPW